MTLMTNLDWCDIKHFKPSEFSEPNKMDYHFINRLDKFREMIDKPIIIHSSYRNDPKSKHFEGIAVDMHVVGVDLMDMFLLAEKSDLFKGIGVYPNWNNAGLHIDMRRTEARWGCWTPTGVEKKGYVVLNSDFWKRYFQEKYPTQKS